MCDADHTAEALQLRATFVTLTIDDRLRGCCGTLVAHRPLVEDVWHNAQASAFDDPRFVPLVVQEFEQLAIEVAVLSPTEPLSVPSEAALMKVLVPGRDGVVLNFRGHRATFLPKVWDHLPDSASFLRELKRKAGLPADFWSPEILIERYSTTSVKGSTGSSIPKP